MELKELTDRTFELFGVDDPDDLGSALLKNISSTDKLKAFCDLVDGDLSIDWMQMIYQYYLADRKEKKSRIILQNRLLNLWGCLPEMVR